MSKVAVHIHRKSLEKKAAEAVSLFLLKHKEHPILVLVSGGSSLGVLNRTILSALGDRVTVTVLDERFSVDPAVNNFLQMAITDFYEEAKKLNVNFLITVPLPNEHIQDVADRWQFDLRLWLANHPKGKIFAIMGMGEDGHTAGIMPYPENEWIFNELFDDQDKWVVAYDAREKDKYPERITTTVHFLRSMVDEAVMFVKGEKKAKMLARALEADGKIHEVPVRIIHQMKKVTIFTDADVKKHAK